MKRFTMMWAAAMCAQVVLPGPALADKMPGNVLVETCNRTDEGAVAVCSAYFMGVLEGLAMAKRVADNHRPVCVAHLAPKQLRGEFLVYAKANKPMDRTSAEDMVMTVLFAEHTCPAHND